MAIPAQSLTFIGQPLPPVLQGQVITGNETGPLTKALAGTAVFTLDGTLTSATLNWIDGVQLLGQTQYPLSVNQASAASGGLTTYSQGGFSLISGMSFSAIRIGYSVVVSGFSNAGNNGTFTVSSVGPSSVTVSNAGGVAEFNPAGLMLVPVGSPIAAVNVTRSGINDTAAAGFGIVGASSITNKGCILHFSGAGSNGQTVGVLANLYFQTQ